MKNIRIQIPLFSKREKSLQLVIKLISDIFGVHSNINLKNNPNK